MYCVQRLKKFALAALILLGGATPQPSTAGEVHFVDTHTRDIILAPWAPSVPVAGVAFATNGTATGVVAYAVQPEGELGRAALGAWTNVDVGATARAVRVTWQRTGGATNYLLWRAQGDATNYASAGVVTSLWDYGTNIITTGAPSVTVTSVPAVRLAGDDPDTNAAARRGWVNDQIATAVGSGAAALGGDLSGPVTNANLQPGVVGTNELDAGVLAYMRELAGVYESPTLPTVTNAFSANLWEYSFTNAIYAGHFYAGLASIQLIGQFSNSYVYVDSSVDSNTWINEAAIYGSQPVYFKTTNQLHLRFYTDSFPLPGEMAQTAQVERIELAYYVLPENAGQTNDMTWMRVYVDDAEESLEPVNLRTHIRDLAAIRVDRWSDHAAASAVNLAGQPIYFGNQWGAQQVGQTLYFSYLGAPVFELHNGGTITPFIVSAAFGLSTGQLMVISTPTASPIAQQSLDMASWSTLGSYTASHLTNGLWRVAFPASTATTVFYRAVCTGATGAASSAVLRVPLDMTGHAITGALIHAGQITDVPSAWTDPGAAGWSGEVATQNVNFAGKAARLTKYVSFSSGVNWTEAEGASVIQSNGAPVWISSGGAPYRMLYDGNFSPATYLTAASWATNSWKIVAPPASASSFGAWGQMAYDATNIYVYHAASSRWMRIPGVLEW